jgi:D-3-phosphoglycerate dehydrogenase / 2-oxoglutarate reductase
VTVATALITCSHLQRHFDRFKPEFDALGVTPILPATDGQQLDGPAMASLIEGVDAVIAGDDVIDGEVLRAGRDSRLKAVIKWGIGTDAIDTTTAAELGIAVFNTPGAFADEVADLALSHLLLLARKPHEMHASVLDGGWLKVEGRSLAGLTAGIIGLGSIGSAIARRATAFELSVVGYDVRDVWAAKDVADGPRQVDLDALYGASDVVFLACELTPENRHLLSRSAFARMRDGVLVVNVARGALIDQEALVEALASGRVAGAGLDVFEDEPLPPDDPLRAFSGRCVFTTHNASNTAQAVARVNQMATDILFDVLGLKKIERFAPNRVA